MITRDFPTLAVLTVYTGHLLATGDEGDFHAVMDHLYPGIMTIGCAAMQPAASRHLRETVPGIAALPFAPVTWASYALRALEHFGPTLPVSGPLNVSDAEVSKAFADFGAYR